MLIPLDQTTLTMSSLHISFQAQLQKRRIVELLQQSAKSMVLWELLGACLGDLFG